MRIPEEKLSKWKELQSYGDITKMANGNESMRVYLSNAINTGRCTDEAFKILDEFYTQKEQDNLKEIEDVPAII